jgi:CHAT domain-containing protein
MALLENAARRHESLNNGFELAVVHNQLGVAEYHQGYLHAARSRFESATALFESLNETGWVQRLLGNRAKISERLGQLRQAVALYDRALSSGPLAPVPVPTGWLYESSADAYLGLGEPDEAFRRYETALRIFEAFPDYPAAARVLDGIGKVYNQYGDWPNAADSFERALELHALGDERVPRLETLISLGNALRNQGLTAQAQAQHERALALAATPQHRAEVLLELARDAREAGAAGQAAMHLDQVFEAAAANEGMVLKRGEALVQRAELALAAAPERAVADLEEALTLFRAEVSESGQVRALHALARAHQHMARPGPALGYSNQALALIEALRIRVGSPMLRATYAGLQRPSYELQIDLLMQLAREQSDERPADWIAQALEMSERAHARMLVELLSRSPGGEPSEELAQLRTRHAELRREMIELEYGATVAGEREQLRRRRENRSRELGLVENEIWRLSTGRGDAPPPYLSSVRIQELVGGGEQGTLLLEYAVGAARSYAWAVSASSVTSAELPPARDLEALVEAVQAAAASASPTLRKEETRRALAGLGERVLAPFSGALAHARRVVIVADGPLHFVPFAAVPSDGAPLIDTHEVVMLPSVWSLAMQRDRAGRRPPPQKSVAIFADPVFALSEPTSRAEAASQAPADRTEPAREVMRSPGALPRLPGTRREAQAIAALAGADAFSALGLDATRRAVLDSPLGDYRYVHFATHGLVDSRYPELSSLAMSAYDRHGNPSDAFLQLHDIYDLRLNADVVVLSACSTALGRNVRGEGLIGLTQAFFHAGARQVVASLWKVPDAATAELMTAFYRGMMEEGLRPSAALRESQRSLQNDERWGEPYYWAAFTIQGDWQ